MIRNVPETGASTSFVDLSLSMAKSGSPSTTAPPSATSHSLSNPSFIEKPSLGMRISTAMIDPFLSHHCSHCRLDCFGGRRKGRFERIGEGNGAECAAQPHHRAFPGAEQSTLA